MQDYFKWKSKYFYSWLSKVLVLKIILLCYVNTWLKYFVICVLLDFKK